MECPFSCTWKPEAAPIPPVTKNERKQVSAPRAPIPLFVLFVILTVAIAGVAFRYSRSQKDAIEQEVANQLLAVADLKVLELSEWRTQQIQEARVLATESLGAGAMLRVSSETASAVERARVENWLTEFCRRLQFASATITDRQGDVVLSVGRTFGGAEHLRPLAREVVERNDIVFRDFHMDPSSGAIHLSINLPLRAASGGAAQGAVLLGIDPTDYLYPLLQRQPLASRSGETLLARREGAEVVFLNDLRFRRQAALRLRIPMSRTDAPLVQAIQGMEGSLAGRDYRGVAVFAAARRVPNTPWMLVSKVDAEEVEAPIRRRAAILSAAAVSLILVAGVVVVLLWRRQQLRFYRAEYEAEVEHITERKAMDEQLRRMLDTLSAVVESSPAAILSVSVDFRVTTWNKAAERMFGWTAEEVVGGPPPFVPKGRLERAHEVHARVLRGEIITSMRTRGMRKDGGEIALSLSAAPLHDPDGGCTGLALNLLDVTEHAKAEAALTESESRFRRVVENAPEGILVERNLEILYVNAATMRMAGAVSAKDLVGHNMLERVHPDERADAAERSADVARGESVGATERRCLTMKGEELHTEISAAPIRYDGGPASLVFVRDITERKRTEAEKAHLEEQLRQAQKMESLGRLAGGVAHDFNNHLTVITGYCDMLLSGFAPDDPAREEVEEIRAAGNRAAALTQQLLAFSRKQIAEPKPVDLNLVVAESGRMLRRLMGEHIEIEADLGRDLSLVVVDRGQVGQVLMNLAINARDAMPSGGSIVIATADVELNAESTELVPEATPGSYVRLSVSDAGVGMSPETLAHIFEPFFTTKGAGIGTGLGLSTVYGIVQQSHGWIRVSSQPGKGTTFRIYLPRAAGGSLEVEAPAVEAGMPRGIETILVTEDQPEVRRLAMEILKRSGYHLLEAADGQQAMAVSAAHTGPIHLLVTDVVMPGMTGRELARQMVTVRPAMKVLYTSGYTADALSHEGLVDPGVAYLPKPFTVAQLSIKVREVLGLPRTPGTIVVVDDDDGVRGWLVQVLMEAGYRVLSARDGKAGIRLVAENAVDVVLTDLIMPGQEGIETIQELRREHPCVKIAAMSGAFDGAYLKTAALLGAQATLRKPIEPEELLAALRGLLQA